MSGLIQNQQSNLTFVNIKEGKIYAKNEKYDSLVGTITKVEYIIEEFQGRKYEKAKIYIFKEDEKYILQMNTKSGYFRSFCNALKSGDARKEITITPSKKEENGKSQNNCFVSQNGKYLKHYFTKNFNGKNDDILPELEKVIFKGETHYDNSKQIEYWKKWLKQQFDIEVEEDLVQMEDDDDMPF